MQRMEPLLTVTCCIDSEQSEHGLLVCTENSYFVKERERERERERDRERQRERERERQRERDRERFL